MTNPVVASIKIHDFAFILGSDGIICLEQTENDNRISIKNVNKFFMFISEPLVEKLYWNILWVILALSY